MLERCYDLFEPRYEGPDAKVEVVGIGRLGYRVDDEPVAAHGAEYEVGTPGVKGDDNALVCLIHGIFIVFV